MISKDLESRVNCFTSSHFQRDWRRDKYGHISINGAEDMLRLLGCDGPYGSEQMYLEIAAEQMRVANEIRDRYKVADEIRSELDKMTE